MTDKHSPFRVLLRLAPSAVVVLCWFIFQNNIEILDSCARPQLLLAALGIFYVLAPLCPYANRIGREMPKDFWAALVVSFLGLAYTVAFLVGGAFFQHLGPAD